MDIRRIHKTNVKSGSSAFFPEQLSSSFVLWGSLTPSHLFEPSVFRSMGFAKLTIAHFLSALLIRILSPFNPKTVTTFIDARLLQPIPMPKLSSALASLTRNFLGSLWPKPAYKLLVAVRANSKDLECSQPIVSDLMFRVRKTASSIPQPISGSLEELGQLKGTSRC